ncbi:MAG: DUF1127 domain-containing protein [Rhodobacter sp.]|nr:DUF1127 domain-containing protein [Rhodobacter sp.]
MTTSHHTAPAPAYRTASRDWFDRFFAGIGQGFNAYLESRSRMAQFERLNAKSNDELAEMGLKREDIGRHVFRDLFYI